MTCRKATDGHPHVEGLIPIKLHDNTPCAVFSTIANLAGYSNRDDEIS